jgi:hypothetical protein
MTPETQIIGPVTGQAQTGADGSPLPPLSSPSMLPAVPSLPSQVREYIRASKAENTLRGYQSVSAGIEGSHFRRRDREPMPPEMAIRHTSALTAARSSGWTATYFTQL